MTMEPKKRVCYVSCYKDPDYTRINSLLNALSKLENIDLIVVKNKHRGLLRYLEVPAKLLKTRFKRHPDIFIVGFRSNEIYWALYPAMIGKKIIFDEFINLHDWLANEHNKILGKPPFIWIIDWYMRLVLSASSYVLTDTDAQAKLCAQTYKVSPNKVKAIPVGADEKIFYPRQPSKVRSKFNVFFYGNMLPLHGIDIILGSIKEILQTRSIPDIHVTLVGGRGDQNLIDYLHHFIVQNGGTDFITHIPWVEYEKLPQLMADSNLCLGGPFGNTGQAKRVITGKTYQMLSMGKATIVGHIEEMVGFEDKNNCLIVKQGSAKDLATAIEWASSNSPLLVRIGANGRKLYEQRFSSQVISQLLSDLISNL